jgi:hypothetical protein
MCRSLFGVVPATGDGGHAVRLVVGETEHLVEIVLQCRVVYHKFRLT